MYRVKLRNAVGLLCLPAGVIPKNKTSLVVNFFHHLHEIGIGQLIYVSNKQTIEMPGWHGPGDLHAFHKNYIAVFGVRKCDVVGLIMTCILHKRLMGPVLDVISQ